MANLGFYFDSSVCTGCRTCQVACKDRNNLDAGIKYRAVSSYETGKYPSASIYHYSAACNHCEAPACVVSCPTGSMQKAPDDGTVQHEDELCIGCGSCVKSCPYGVPVLLADKGIAGKCDACKPFRDVDLNPVCVDACVMRCLDFGDLDELRAKYAQGAQSELVNELPILPDPSTNPSLLINPKEAAKATDFREVAI